MKKNVRGIGKVYTNQPIKNKLVILISMIMFISFASTVAGLQYTFFSYDEQLYIKSSQVLSTSSNTIENELKRLEDVTYSISVDPVIQQYLYMIDEMNTEYEQFRIRMEIQDNILKYVNLEQFIQSVHIIDTKKEEYIVGTKPSRMPLVEKEMILAASKGGEGRHIWLEKLSSEGTMIATRAIRMYEDLSFNHLGTVVITVDLNKLVGSLIEGSRELEGYFIIKDRFNNVVYPRESNDFISELAYSDKVKTDYRIQTIDDKKYFNVHMNSNFLQWTYMNVIPFDQVFKNINVVKISIFFIFVCIFLIVLFIGIRFAKGITNPLENLVKSIKHIQKGNFDKAKEETFNLSSLHHDEVGELHQHFIVMIQRIDHLIHANYTKQMAIKDTEFKALQAQINPHFLYNTLESINWLAKTSRHSKISNMVESLGFLLRHSMSLQDSLITIEKELEIVHNYITIQRYRFEERLDFRLEVEEEVNSYLIPKFTLQPIIENAINYALENMVEPCTISLHSKFDGECIELMVEDNGPGIEPELLKQVQTYTAKTRGQGIGLRNIDERIKLLFGPSYGIRIESVIKQGTKVAVILPKDKGR